jgi:hypothetical protein
MNVSARVSTVMHDGALVNVAADQHGGWSVLRVDGVLDSTTYRSIRDQVIKAALDEPRAVIVDVSALQVPAGSAWAVFSSARWHVDRWPEVPIALVCGHFDGRNAIARNGVARCVPVYDTVDSAIDALCRIGTTRGRHRARADLQAHPASVGRARDLVEDWLSAWSRSEMVAVTKVVVSAFVENVLEHTRSAPTMRLESDGRTVTVAVEDNDRSPAIFHESRPPRPLSGLQIVAILSRVWGNAPTPSGKTVWAVVGPENQL